MLVVSTLHLDEPAEKFLQRRTERSDRLLAPLWDRSLAGALADWGSTSRCCGPRFAPSAIRPRRRAGDGLLRRDAGEYPAPSEGNRQRGGRHDRRLPRLRCVSASRRARRTRLSHDLPLAADHSRRDRLLAPARAAQIVARPPRRPRTESETGAVDTKFGGVPLLVLGSSGPG
jgi:hypothetical protein